MAKVLEYHRRGSLEDAIELVTRRGATPLGGGTSLNAATPLAPIEVVDLQELGLNGIEEAPDGRMLIGASVTLQQLSESDGVPPVIKEAARRDLPSTLRAMATLAGSIVSADFESELIATLLVYDAILIIATPDASARIGLDDMLAEPGRVSGHIITAVSKAAPRRGRRRRRQARASG